MAKLIPVGEEDPSAAPKAKMTLVEQLQAAGIPPEISGNYAPVQGERAIEGMKRGALDVGQGIKQLYLMVTNPSEAARYTGEVNKEISDYEQSRGPNPGLDFARMAGNAAATSPAMMLPGGQAGLLARLGMGALSGGLSGAANFSEAGTWEDKGIQTGVGMVAGAAVPEAVRQGVKAAVGVGQAGTNVLRTVLGPGASNAQILSEIQRAGSSIDSNFNLANLSAGLREQLIADAKAQLKNTGKLDPDALMRSQDYAKLGITPTMAQLSRDPRQWQTERNLAQVTGIGDGLMTRFAEQPGILLKNLEGMRTGSATSPYEAGQTAMEVIGSRKARSGMFGELGQNIDDIYKQAREATGAQAEIPFKPFKAQIGSTIEQFEDKIPAPIVKRLQQFDDPKSDRYFSVAEAAKFRELINARIADGDPAQAKALGAIKRELDKYMETIGDSVGDEGVEAIKLFQRGMKASAKRAQEFGAPPLSQTVAGEVQPDDFFRRFILNGKVADLTQLRNNLNRTDVSEPIRQQAGAAWENLRGQTIQWLIGQASKDGEAFSQAGFRNALQSLGPRLEVLFTPEERGMLFTIQRASHNLLGAPATGGVPIMNTSGTGGMLANLVLRASDVPGPNMVLQNAAARVREQAQLNAAQRALVGGVGEAAAASRAADQEAFRRMMGNAVTNPLGLQPFSSLPPSVAEVNRDARARR